MGFLMINDKVVDKNKTKKLVEHYLYLYSNISAKLLASSQEKAVEFLNSEVTFLGSSIKVYQFVDLMDKSISALAENQRCLIVEKYVKNNGNDFDYIVKENLKLAERTYYRIKLNALLSLAQNLNALVFNDN